MNKVDKPKQRNGLEDLHRDLENYKRMGSPPAYVSASEHLQTMLETVRLQNAAVSRAINFPKFNDQIDQILSANKRWQELIKQVTEPVRIAEQLATTHQSWIQQMNSNQGEFSKFSQIQEAVKLALCNSSVGLIATQRLMAGIDFSALQKRLRMETPVMSELNSSILRTTDSFSSLTDSLGNLSNVANLPAFVLPGATREMLTTSLALNSISSGENPDQEEIEARTAIIVQAEDEITHSLPILKAKYPELALPYMGAKNALQSTNPDKARHILISLRELWTHLLRRLAPDPLVSPWITSLPSQKDLLHNGNPTRRSKILYICRNLNNGPLGEFMTHDTKSLVTLIELFNRVHELETGMSDVQLRALILKTESWLTYLLQIAMENEEEGYPS